MTRTVAGLFGSLHVLPYVPWLALASFGGVCARAGPPPHPSPCTDAIEHRVSCRLLDSLVSVGSEQASVRRNNQILAALTALYALAPLTVPPPTHARLRLTAAPRPPSVRRPRLLVGVLMDLCRSRNPMVEVPRAIRVRTVLCGDADRDAKKTRFSSRTFLSRPS